MGRGGMAMGTQHQGSPTEIRALDAYIKLMRAAASVQGVMDARLAPLGFTENQFGVLETIWHLGPMNQRTLVNKLLTSKANINAIVDNLEKRGLVHRERESKDKRHVTVHLTVEGRKIIAELFPGHVALIVQTIGALTASEQEILSALCKKLGIITMNVSVNK